MPTDQNIERYTNFPFPSNRYIPGQGMHPRKSPYGSHIPELPTSSIKFGAKTWRDSFRYLYAIDLFNYGYWWEAHEVLEDLWIVTGKETLTGRFIQGLIQICAALLKETQSIHSGALRLAEKGLSKILLRPDVFLGLDVTRFRDCVESFLSGESSSPPIIVLSVEKK